MEEIEKLKTRVKIETACLQAAMELADYETAHICADALSILTRQILLCQQQAVQELK